MQTATAAGEQVKPTIVYETAAEHEARQLRARETDSLLRRVEAQERARWPTAAAMLSWFFALKDHMASIPAVNPAADVIQGLRVERDERLYWIGKARLALAALERHTGSGFAGLLLWLYFRPRVLVGHKRRKGVRVAVYAEPVPRWELSRAPELSGYPSLSQRAAVEAFGLALRWVEDYAYSRGWVKFRARRRRRVENCYRRRDE